MRAVHSTIAARDALGTTDRVHHDRHLDWNFDEIHDIHGDSQPVADRDRRNPLAMQLSVLFGSERGGGGRV